MRSLETFRRALKAIPTTYRIAASGVMLFTAITVADVSIHRTNNGEVSSIPQIGLKYYVTSESVDILLSNGEKISVEGSLKNIDIFGKNLVLMDIVSEDGTSQVFIGSQKKHYLLPGYTHEDILAVDPDRNIAKVNLEIGHRENVTHVMDLNTHQIIQTLGP